MAWSYTESSDNVATGSWAVSTPALSTGDMLIINISWDDSTNVTDITAPSGPNGETAVVIEGPTNSDTGSVGYRGKVIYYIATGNWSAGTTTITPSASEQWAAVVIKIPSGEFDATTPIGAHTSAGSLTTTTTPTLPALTANSDDGGGTLVGYFGIDIETTSGTVTGWTQRASTDYGSGGNSLYTRDSSVTNSESISATSGWTIPTSRLNVAFIYIVRAGGSPPSSNNSSFFRFF